MKESEFPAIRALGSLFKLTEAYIWSDGTTETRKASLFRVPRKSRRYHESISSSNQLDCSVLPVEDEVANQMSVLGLPLAFQSNKELLYEPSHSSKTLHEENGSHHAIVAVRSQQWQCTKQIRDKPKKGKMKVSLLRWTSGIEAKGKDEEQVCSKHGELMSEKKTGYHGEPNQMNCHSDATSNDDDERSSMADDLEPLGESQISSSVLGDWGVHWDSFYRRDFFYNSKTHVSTWDPPPCAECLPFETAAVESSEPSVPTVLVQQQPTTVGGEEDFEDSDEFLKKNESCDDGGDQVICDVDDGGAAVGNQRRNPEEEQVGELLGGDLLPEYCTSRIGKYWCQRHVLFSRFEDGIKMDEEGWFSVTPEPIAKHHALRCFGGSMIDCFTGVGGNAIQFANKCNHVTAIDKDSDKIDYARHNAAIYGVDDRIDFIKGDFFALAPNLKADTVFLSPPWGGPHYAKAKTYNLKTMLKPHNGHHLFLTAKQIAYRIVMFLPRNTDLNQLAELSLLADPPWLLEIEKNFLNGKLKALTAYFSNIQLPTQA